MARGQIGRAQALPIVSAIDISWFDYIFIYLGTELVGYSFTLPQVSLIQIIHSADIYRLSTALGTWDSPGIKERESRHLRAPVSWDSECVVC